MNSLLYSLIILSSFLKLVQKVQQLTRSHDWPSCKKKKNSGPSQTTVRKDTYIDKIKYTATNLKYIPLIYAEISYADDLAEPCRNLCCSQPEHRPTLSHQYHRSPPVAQTSRIILALAEDLTSLRGRIMLDLPSHTNQGSKYQRTRL